MYIIRKLTTLSNILPDHRPTRFICSLSFVLISSLSMAQAPIRQWGKVIGGDNNDDAYAIVSLSDGGYLVGGTSESDISKNRTAPKKGSTDFWVVRLDGFGNTLWDKSFGGASSNGLQAIVQASDGGFLLGGYSTSGISGDKTQANQGGQDFWIVKIDDNGNKLWDKTFGGAENDAIWTITQTTDGGYLLAGTSTSDISGDKTQANRGGQDFWVVKVDASGQKQWDVTLGGSARDELFAAIATMDGGYLVGGISDSGISGDKTEASRGGLDYWTIKLSATGEKQWNKTFGGSSNPDPFMADDRLSSLLQAEDGGYILAGHSNSAIGADKTAPKKGTEDYDDDYWVIKINSNGNKQWDKTYGGVGGETLRATVKSPLGGYVLVGESGSGISGDKTEEIIDGSGDYWMIKINSRGEKQWDKTLGDNAIEIPYAITVNNKGEYAVAGLRVAGIITDFQVFKTSAESFILPPPLKVNFQNKQTIPPQGYLADYGQAFGARTGTYQGNAYVYGWKNAESGIPIDLTANTRRRPQPADLLLATLLHMQANNVKNFRGNSVEGYWEMAVENGNYQVTVSVGDGSVYTFTDKEFHSINIEGMAAITRFVPTGPQGSLTRFKSATLQVTVSDGLLTIDADGGQNTKINYAIIQPLQQPGNAVSGPFQTQNLQPSFTPQIQVSPNPFSDKLILFSEDLSGTVKVSVQDALGNTLYTTITTPQAGQLLLDVSGAKLKAGVYFIKCSWEDGTTKTVKTVKQ